MRHDRSFSVRETSILARKRFQFLTALLIGALVPWLMRGAVLPGDQFDPPVTNTLIGNLVAVALAFWMRLSVETYPGIRRSYVILPSALTGHGIVVFWFLVTRFNYDRVGLVLGFMLHVLWLYTLYIYAERRVRRRIAIVPYGAIENLGAIVPY